MGEEELRAISARIAGIIEAANYFTPTVRDVGSDYYGASYELIRNAKDIVSRLQAIVEM